MATGIIEYLGYVAALYLSYRIAKLTLTLLHATLLARPLDVTRLGKWAVVTGSTDGIGKAYAFALARAGLNVVLVSRSPFKLQNVAAEIEQKCKVKTKIVDVDFANADPKAYVEKLEKELAGLEVGLLVNNVGMGMEFPMAFLDMEDGAKLTRDLVEVNITSMNAMTRLVLPQMVARGRGAVVNIGSMSAMIPTPMYGVYAATKAYVVKFSECLDTEYARKGVIVQCVNPGYVVSKMSKLKKAGLFAPTPEAFVASALGRLGAGGVTYGYWAHDLMATGIHLLPAPLANKIVYDQILAIRQKALKRAATGVADKAKAQ